MVDLAPVKHDGRAPFAAIPSNPAVPNNRELGRPLLEPHESWMERIGRAWVSRYGAG